MRYNSIDSFEYVNGVGIGISLFVQGCHKHCKNCFNPETWDFNGGKVYDEKVQTKIIDLISQNHISRLSILGGEPLDLLNISDVYNLIKTIREKFGDTKKIWVYTGLTYEIVKSNYPEILLLIDVLVDGEYMDELRDVSLKFRGSSNQRIINVKQTIAKGEIVLYER